MNSKIGPRIVATICNGGQGVVAYLPVGVQGWPARRLAAAIVSPHDLALWQRMLRLKDFATAIAGYRVRIVGKKHKGSYCQSLDRDTPLLPGQPVTKRFQ